ncbi:hypothetical protein ACIQXQ_01705 [Peribacillus sp. NPDC097198]|uniref:hypothetical protein n=1 Tax=Peribacillus sp. NPDC097198 TaxID=3364397 RepID=UPI0037F7A705
MDIEIIKKNDTYIPNKYEVERSKRLREQSNILARIKNVTIFMLIIIFCEKVILEPLQISFKWTQSTYVYWFSVFIVLIYPTQFIYKIRIFTWEMFYKRLKFPRDHFSKLLSVSYPLFLAAFLYVLNRGFSFEIGNDFWKNLEFEHKLIIPILLGFLLNIIISAFPGYVSYRLVSIVNKELAKKFPPDSTENEINKDKKKSTLVDKVESLVRKCKQVIIFVVSPTFVYAKCFKDKLERESLQYITVECTSKKCFKGKLDKDDKENRCECYWETIQNQKRDILQYINWINLLLVIFLYFLYGFLFLSKVGFFVELFLVTFILHFISRSIEIVYAFYIDVVRVNLRVFVNAENIKVINEWRNSSLQKSTRISLAFHSLLEVIISFVIIYVAYIYFNGSFHNGSIDIDFSYPLKLSDYYSLLMYSFSVSVFNVSLINHKNDFSWLIHIWQVGLSINLIILSLAYYIGMDNKMTKKQATYFYNLHRNNK